MRMKRVSITKAQRDSAIGAELLELCQTITEDGALSREEIIAITKWLKQNRNADLPAIAFLTATVEKIIADGKVTREERRELYQAIERILPPDVRKEAQAARHYVEREQRAAVRAARDERSLRDREERERQRPLASADFMVAGVRYEGRANVVRRYVRGGEQVFLARDKQNRHSRNAIEVRLSNGFQIGFVPEEDAVDLAPLLDTGDIHHAFVKRVWDGRDFPIPIVVAKVYRPDAGVTDAVRQDEIPEKRQPGSNFAIVIGALVLLGLIAVCSGVFAGC